MCVISAPGKLRQEDCHKFGASLEYRVELISTMPSKIKQKAMQLQVNSSSKPLEESWGDNLVTGDPAEGH